MMDIDHLEYAIRNLKSPVEKALAEIEKINDSIKQIRGIDYIITAFFEGTERYCWVIEVLLIFDFKTGERSYMRIYQESVNISYSPNEVLNRIKNIAIEYKTHRIQFDPDNWELIEDKKFDGRLSRWCSK